MGSVWKYKYDKHEIDVMTSLFVGNELYVNGELQDKKTIKGKLNGKLESGEEIKVRIEAGWIRPKCILQVNNRLLVPIYEDNRL